MHLQQYKEMIKIITNKQEVFIRWEDYFSKLINDNESMIVNLQKYS